MRSVVTTEWEQFLAEDLDRRADAGLLRSLREFQREGAWVVTQDGRRLLNFSSNDYLGLASHPDVLEAAARAAARAGGATASRLIVGTDPAYGELEAKLADFQGTEAALVFGSGYLANVGVISSPGRTAATPSSATASTTRASSTAAASAAPRSTATATATSKSSRRCCAVPVRNGS